MALSGIGLLHGQSLGFLWSQLDWKRGPPCDLSLTLLQVTDEEPSSNHTVMIQETLQQASVELAEQHHLVVSSDDVEGIGTRSPSTLRVGRPRSSSSTCRRLCSPKWRSRPQGHQPELLEDPGVPQSRGLHMPAGAPGEAPARCSACARVCPPSSSGHVGPSWPSSGWVRPSVGITSNLRPPSLSAAQTHTHPPPLNPLPGGLASTPPNRALPGQPLCIKIQTETTPPHPSPHQHLL